MASYAAVQAVPGVAEGHRSPASAKDRAALGSVPSGHQTASIELADDTGGNPGHRKRGRTRAAGSRVLRCDEDTRTRSTAIGPADDGDWRPSSAGVMERRSAPTTSSFQTFRSCQRHERKASDKAKARTAGRKERYHQRATNPLSQLGHVPEHEISPRPRRGLRGLESSSLQLASSVPFRHGLPGRWPNGAGDRW